MNLPNKITLTRLIITPFALGFLFLDIRYNILISAIFFIFAMITDVLDGMIARRFDMITKLGAFLDPLADKLIILLYFIYLQSAGVYPLWLLLLFVARELLVDGLRNYSMSQNIYMGAIWSGKLKALFQVSSIVSGLLYLSFDSGQLGEVLWNYEILLLIAFWLMVVSLLFALCGTVLHLKKMIPILFHEE